MKWLALLHRNHPLVAVSLVIGVTVVALAGLPRLAFDDDPRAIIRATGPERERLDAYYADFGPDDQEIVLVIEGSDLFSPTAIAALHELSDAMRSEPDVESVFGLVDVRGRNGFPLLLVPRDDLSPSRLASARAIALAHPLAVHQCLSTDARTTMVTIRLAGRNIPTSRLEAIVRRLRDVARRILQPAGLSFRMTGHPTSRIELLRTLIREAIKFAVLGIFISGAIALAVFRSPGPVIVSSLGPATGVVWVLGGMAWLGVAIDPLLVIVPTLIFIIGFTDSVHLVTDYGHSRREGVAPLSAAARSVENLGPACLLTAITTSVGFVAILVTRSETIRKFGMTSAAATMVQFLAVQLVVPAAAAMWLRNDAPRTAPNPLAQWVTWLEPAYKWMLNRPRTVAAVSVCLTLACFLASFRLESDHRWTESLPEQGETVQVTRWCDRQFGGSMLAYVLIEWPAGSTLESDEVLDTIREAQRASGAIDLPQTPVSILTLLGSIDGPSEDDSNEYLAERIPTLDKLPPELVRRLVNVNKRTTAIAIHVPDLGAAQLSPRFAKLEERLAGIEQVHSGFRLRLTGTVLVAYHNTHRMIEDLAWSMTLAGGMIFFITALLFRSPLMGILSVVPNIFPQAITACLLVLVGQPLTVNSVLAFCLCLGLSVDDTVHFLMRFREERTRGGTQAEVILRTFRAVGGVMIATSLVLVGGFVAMLVSDMPAIRVFATLTAITLLAAIFGDLIMLPSLLLCFSSKTAAKSVHATADVR